MTSGYPLLKALIEAGKELDETNMNSKGVFRPGNNKNFIAGHDVRELSSSPEHFQGQRLPCYIGLRQV